jgi:hypothetical protein
MLNVRRMQAARYFVEVWPEPKARIDLSVEPDQNVDSADAGLGRWWQIEHVDGRTA